MSHMKKPVVQQAPVSLTGLFGGEDDSAEEREKDTFQNESEVMTMNFGGVQVQVRQMAWHRANANQVWPGAFTLVDHMFKAVDDTTGKGRYESKKLLELGSATGGLAIALCKTGKYDVITCDIDDEGEVEENIRWNYEHNGLTPPRHVAHTWGTNWTVDSLGIHYIIASDILLYVSAYAGLVKSLLTIFDREPQLIEFLMSWNRRIKESSIFFDLMKEAGFRCHSYGQGLYSFYLPNRVDTFLQTLERQEK